MAKKITGPRVLTGNLLNDGAVVFLAPGGEWRTGIGEALLARDDSEACRLEEKAADAVRANIVVDPYLIELDISGVNRVPVEFRERRRIAGPSVNLELNSRSRSHAALAG